MNDLPIQNMLLGNNIQHYQDGLENDSAAMPTAGSVSISHITDNEDDEENKEEFWFKKSTSANRLRPTGSKKNVTRISKMDITSADLNEMEV